MRGRVRLPTLPGYIFTIDIAHADIVISAILRAMKVDERLDALEEATADLIAALR
jgi:hypothetical protein